jgi:cytochrome b561
MASRYTPTAISLHWVMALMILSAFALGLYMTELQLSPTKLKLYSWHKWLGVTIFLVAIARLLWRITHAVPRVPDSTPGWQRAAAAFTHWVIYALLIAIPISGWLMSSASGFQVVYFGMLPLPDLLHKDKALAEQLKVVHETLNYTLMALLVLHVGAALKHHLLDRDEVLHRMLPLVKPPPRSDR